MRLLHRPSYRTTWVSRYKNVSILNFIGAKNDGCTVSSTTAHPGLRSAVSTDYVVPRLRMKFGERAFSYDGPFVWNSLPVHVQEEMDFYHFKRLLKTHTFSLAYNVD